MIGSFFAREHKFYKEQGMIKPNPHQQVLNDFTTLIKKLTNNDHKIILVMNTNEILQTDGTLNNFTTRLELHNLQTLRKIASKILSNVEMHKVSGKGCC